MNSLLFDNLLSWSAEVAVLAMAATAAACVLRHSQARLYFWQAVLAVALLLPVIAPWKRPVLVALQAPAFVVLPTNGVRISDVSASANWGVEQLLMLLAAGAVLRLMLVAVGLLRLARIRKLAQPLHNPPVAFGGDARWYLSDEVSGPVTFGWLRPTILLPKTVCELPPSAQEAIASHELFHVHRRDWLFVMAEELIRSVLWFHPAVWFVLSRVQLAREQVVDQEVVHATRDRAGYLDALVSVAAQKLQADVAPAPLFSNMFLKKRQLAVRVQALLKETSMSASRLAAHVSVAATVAVIGVCAAVWFFPLRSAAQMLPDDPGITVDPGALLAHRSPVHNPTAVTGDVMLELSLNSKGEVADARVLSGPDELRKSALASVLDWHYAADTALPSLVHASIHFGQRFAVAAAQAPPPPPPPPPPGARIGNGIGAGIGRGGAPPPPPPPPPPPETAIIQRIEYLGLSPELQQRVQSSLTVREGDTLRLAQWAGIRQSLRSIDEHLVMIVQGDGNSQDSGVTLRIVLRQQPAMAIGAAAGVRLIRRVPPDYPQNAKVARVQGPVQLSATIGPDGRVGDLQVISGPPLLTQAAIDAVSQWVYQPVLLNDKPVSVRTTITVNFVLADGIGGLGR